MTALKAYRADLAAHLAAELDITAPKLGALVNPPAVVVGSGSPYLTGLDYCTDAILFDVTLITTPGDPPAVADALDDFIDLVRPVLKQASPGGHRYALREVSGFVEFPVGDDKTLPAVVISIGIERST